jgi:general secretion pathway protein L
MTLLRNIADWVARWLDAVAATLVAAVARLVSPRVARVVEEADGSGFSVRGPNDARPAPGRLGFAAGGIAGTPADGVAKAIRGNRVEIVLDPSRFVFRRLELPRRAVEFLDGVVRAQIDRLTPWTAGDAVYGWGRPADIAGDRIAVTVAATARAVVRPILQGLSDLGASSIAVLTAPADDPASGAGIKVYDQSVRGMLDPRRVSRVLLVMLLLAVAVAGLAIAADGVIGGSLDARRDDLARRIDQRRGLLRAGPNGVARSAGAQLDRRKHETPATVIVLEALSEILPDETYVTELRVEGNKLQIIGVTRDAPGLIRLIEQSPHFTHATFFAPTTRSPTDPGDRFHIEARIEPVNAPRS